MLERNTRITYLHVMKAKKWKSWRLGRKAKSYEMNIAMGINNHMMSIDLFRSMIILSNRSKVCDDHRPLPPPTTTT